MVLNATVVTHFIVRIVLKMWRQAQLLSPVIAAIIHFALIAASKPALTLRKRGVMGVLGIVKNAWVVTSHFLLDKTKCYAERVAGMMNLWRRTRNLPRRTSNCAWRLKNFKRICRQRWGCRKERILLCVMGGEI